MLVVDSLLIVTPIGGFCNSSMFCCALICVYSSFAIIFMGKRELVTLLGLSSWCLVIFVWLFLMALCLQFVVVVFSDHTHYFCMRGSRKFCQRGSNILASVLLSVLADERREDPNTRTTKAFHDRPASVTPGVSLAGR